MSEYQIPDPKLEPIKCLVLAYKTTKGIEYDNRAWDKAHFCRSTKAAKLLFEICGTLRIADKCILELSAGFNEANMSWTLETIVKHAHDWLSKQSGVKNGHEYRSRFFKALADKGRSGPSTQTSGGQEAVHNPLRSLLDA